MVIVSKPNNDRHFLSFSRKLFLSVISLFLVFAACFIAYQYQREKEYKVELLDMQLQDYNDRLHQELRYLPDSLWTSMLDSYISKHVNKELRVTVVDLHGNVLFDSSQNDSHELDNHIKRPEVQKALKDGKGYDLRRISETTGKTYFYSATAYEGCIIRSALPYNVNLMNNLAADPHYIWFTVIVSLLLISVFYKFTSKLGSAINHLREFAKRADKNEPIDMDIQAAFPHNELGEISQHIIQIYKRLRETKEALYIEREKLITICKPPRRTGRIQQRQKGDIGKQSVHPIRQSDFRLQPADYRRDILHLRIPEDNGFHQQGAEAPLLQRRTKDVRTHQQERTHLHRGVHHLPRPQL